MHARQQAVRTRARLELRSNVDWMDSMKKKNLLSIAKKTIGGSTIEDSGIFHNKYAATSHYDLVYWTFDEQMAFDYSNTFYVALSVKGAAASTNTLSMIIECKDANGTTYRRSSSFFPITKN